MAVNQDRSVAEESALETGVAPYTRYTNMISAYDNEFKKWETRAAKIVRRYRDDERIVTNQEVAKFNILWSNVQTLIPAVFARMPDADVSRRFGDNDEVGRVASLLIERAIDFEIEHYPDFRYTMRNCVEDRFLGGRGTSWVRYEPHVRAQEMPGMPEDGDQITEDTDEVDERETEPGEIPEEIDYECAPVDYVHWKDFGHNYARTWEEVTCVWRWVYMDRQAVIKRFGKKVEKKIPFNQGPSRLNGTKDIPKEKEADRAKICELWDKESGKAYWFCKDVPEFLDVKDDPLDLEGFFPCARPLYATTTSDSLVPVPDFCLYQDQARELDILSDRIDGFVKALKIRGVYDASVPALQRLLTEGDNNTLVPVDKWNVFSEKGGLKGAIDLLPIDVLTQALLDAYKARADIKGQIYEITGIADIIRGQTEASETATAQQIKGQYAGLRLRSMQEDVALFATDLIRLKAQIICTKFSDQTILQYAAARQLKPADQQLIPQALQLIKDRPLRNFRIEVAADSLVQIDEMQHKKDTLEFIETFGGFLEKALPVGQTVPTLVPLILELLKTGVGAFKAARTLEGTIDQMLDQFQQAQMQPKQPKPDPEMAKVQAQAQADQARAQADMQVEQMKAQMQQQIEKEKMALAAQTAQAEAAIEQQRLNIEREKIAANVEIERNKITAANDLALADLSMRLQHEAQMASASHALEREKMAHAAETAKAIEAAKPVAPPPSPTPMPDPDAHKPLELTMKALAGAIERSNSPRRIVRGADGSIEGIQ